MDVWCLVCPVCLTCLQGRPKGYHCFEHGYLKPVQASFIDIEMKNGNEISRTVREYGTGKIFKSKREEVLSMAKKSKKKKC